MGGWVGPASSAFPPPHRPRATATTTTQVKGKSGERWRVVYRNGLQEDMTPTELKTVMGTRDGHERFMGGAKAGQW